MDFTDTYRLTTTDGPHRTFAYSPGSTFLSTLHHLGDAGATVVQVRVSTSLQVVRSWTLDFLATSVSWSRSGALLLVACRGQLVVLAVDPSAIRGGHTSEGGLVASIKAGMEGMASVSWVGSGEQEGLCLFSADEVMASIYNIDTGSVLVVANPKRARVASSSSTHHVALLTRQAAKDNLVILAAPSPRHGPLWRTEEQFALHTNDAVEVAWSPNGRHLAVREGMLEYKAQIYSPLGHLQASFQVDCNPTDVHSQLTSLYSSVKLEGNARLAGGGLGIRAMRWHPSGELLALGGYDEIVRVLESDEWSVAACLDLSQRIVAPKPNAAAMGPLTAWREPLDWRRETGGRGIVPYEAMDMPFTVASLCINMSSGTGAKSGIGWMEWNHDGTLLGVRNDNHPAVVYIYAFPRTAAQEHIERIQPYLLSVVTLASTVTVSAWKPVLERRQGQAQAQEGRSDLAIMTSHSQSIHLWSYRAGDTPIQVVEAIPIPVDEFDGVDFAYAPDGNKMLIASRDDTYCCAIEAEEEGDGARQASHL